SKMSHLPGRATLGVLCEFGAWESRPSTSLAALRSGRDDRVVEWKGDWGTQHTKTLASLLAWTGEDTCPYVACASCRLYRPTMLKLHQPNASRRAAPHGATAG